MTGRTLLTLAAVAVFAIAATHVVIILVGPEAYRYFEAGEEMARMAESGSLLPTAATLAIALGLAVFGIYAVSGAGFMRPLPLLRMGLVAIGAIFTLRGLFAILLVYMLITAHPGYELKHLVFSLVALAVGSLYLLGTWKAWRRLSGQK